MFLSIIYLYLLFLLSVFRRQATEACMHPGRSVYYTRYQSSKFDTLIGQKTQLKVGQAELLSIGSYSSITDDVRMTKALLSV
jgi:hypothetical protein